MLDANTFSATSATSDVARATITRIQKANEGFQRRLESDVTHRFCTDNGFPGF
jgi:hypothetical protein